MKRLDPACCVPALAGIAACSLALPDQVTQEARSPDGALVARAWCVDGCDVFQSRTLTISPADLPVAEYLPASHSVRRIWIIEADDPQLELRWTGERHLIVGGECLSDGDYRPLTGQRNGDVTIEYRRLPTGRRCESPR